MADKIKKNGSVYWLDGEGDPIPTRHVPKQDRKRDRLVERSFTKVAKLHDRLKKTKQRIVEMIDKYLNEFADEYGEDWKGNATLHNWTQNKEIIVNISKKIAFNEKLQIAKKKIDNLIEKWSQDSNQNLKSLITKAFKVDSKGKVDSRLILSLRNINIQNKEWKAAMDLISDAVYIEYTRRYYQFRYKNEAGTWKTVNLNFSSIAAE